MTQTLEEKRAAKAYHAAYYAVNRDELRAKQAVYRAAHLEEDRARSRATHYRTTYGITVENKQAMIDAQNGLCAICEIELAGLPQRNVHIDHNHETGQIRGVLCHLCNTSLGRLEPYLDKIVLYARS